MGRRNTCLQSTCRRLPHKIALLVSNHPKNKFASFRSHQYSTADLMEVDVLQEPGTGAWAPNGAKAMMPLRNHSSLVRRTNVALESQF
jgi:hypothetical protein